MNCSPCQTPLTPYQSLGLQQLKDSKTRMKVKKANRTRAKDLWYTWHCETCGEEFTDHGEQGYESDDDPDW